MHLHRLRQRLRNLTRPQRVPPVTREELDENTAALIDAALQSLVFCLSLLALVTCLERLPRLPAPPANASGSGQAWPAPQELSLGFSG